MASFLDINSYLNKVAFTFFDAIVALDHLVNDEFYPDKDEILMKIALLAHIQDSCYHSDQYSKMTVDELKLVIETQFGDMNTSMIITQFDKFEYVPSSPEEEQFFHSIILRIWIYRNTFVHNNEQPFQSSWTDDYYEWFVYNKLKNASVEDRCIGMHDAWTLALLYGIQYNGEKFIFSPKKENGLHSEVTEEIDTKIPVINDPENMIDTSLLQKKDLIKIEFYDMFNVEHRTLRLENRRLTQLVDYAILSKEEQVKDLIPAMVCFSICI